MTENPTPHPAHSLSDEELAMLRGLNQRGYAVIIWTPNELQDVDPQMVEDRLIEYGQSLIEAEQVPQESAGDI